MPSNGSVLALKLFRLTIGTWHSPFRKQSKCVHETCLSNAVCSLLMNNPSSYFVPVTADASEIGNPMRHIVVKHRIT